MEGLDGFEEGRPHLGGTARSPSDVLSLHELGLQFAEIPLDDPVDFEQVKGAYLDLQKKLGLYYVCHGPREGDPNDKRALEKGYLPKLIRLFPLMTQLKMRLLTIHLWLDPRFVGQETLVYKVSLLQRLAEMAETTGVTLCVENLSEDAFDMAGPFDALPRLNLTLDLGHAELLSNRNTSYGFIERYPERIKHIHLHDNFGGRSPKDDLHLPVGEGSIDFKAIFRRLRAINYDRTITLELKPPEIRKCLGFVREVLLGDWHK